MGLSPCRCSPLGGPTRSVRWPGVFAAMRHGRPFSEAHAPSSRWPGRGMWVVEKPPQRRNQPRPGHPLTFEQSWPGRRLDFIVGVDVPPLAGQPGWRASRRRQRAGWTWRASRRGRRAERTGLASIETRTARWVNRAGEHRDEDGALRAPGWRASRRGRRAGWTGLASIETRTACRASGRGATRKAA